MNFKFAGLEKRLRLPGFFKRTPVKRGYRRTLKLRPQSGNMIAFISAITLGLVLAILFFALKYTRMLGSSQEQRTAIEGAALQVANDISRIVYEDPNVGIVALSDFAPIGANTAALDGQPTPVRGINTVLGTARLDMIIANAVNSEEMKLLALADYNNAVAANNALQAQIQDACLPTPTQTHLDWDGNQVNVYQDAITAYNQNIIRMSGSQTALDASTLKITLGVLKNGAGTNTAVPQPTSTYGNVTAAQTQLDTFPNNQQVTCYKSYTNIPYNSKPFVFCGVDNSLKLVDINQFSTDTSALPFFLTSIVKVEGDQVYQPDSNAPGSRVHSVSCAQPASAGDPRSFPGAMVIGFPDGTLPELTAPIDIFNNPVISQIPVTISTSPTGDNGPFTTVSPNTSTPKYPTLGAWMGSGNYHFIKRGGTKLNVASFLNALNTNFGSSSSGTMNVYTMDTNGNIVITPQAETSARQLLTSNHQLQAHSRMIALSANGKVYGVVGTDLVAVPGITYGGSHAGEPLLGAGQTSDWNGGLPMASVGAKVNTVMTPVLLVLTSVLTFILSLVGIATTILFGTGVPTSTTGYTAVPRITTVTRAPTSTAARVARDTYTQQGLAFDLEFPKAGTQLGAW